MHRQYGDNISKRKIGDRSNMFTNFLLNVTFVRLLLAVGDFFKRKRQVQSRLRKSFSFEERKIHKANRCIKSNYIKKAMEILLRGLGVRIRIRRVFEYVAVAVAVAGR